MKDWNPPLRFTNKELFGYDASLYVDWDVDGRVRRWYGGAKG
jgi:hypothetical protein